MTERDDKPMRDVDERLADHVDGRLSARERDRFDAELRVNPQLRQDLADYERTVASLRQALAAPTHKVSLADRVVAAIAAEEVALAQPSARGGGFRFGWWSLASAAALLGLALMIDRWSAAPTAEVTAKQDAAVALAKAEPDELLLLRRGGAGAEADAVELKAALAASDGGLPGQRPLSEPPAGEPSVGGPPAVQPPAVQPAAGQPAAGQTPAGELTAGLPGQPAAGQPAADEKPTGEKPAGEKSSDGRFGSRGRNAIDEPTAPAPAPEPAVTTARAAPPEDARELRAGLAQTPSVTVPSAEPGVGDNKSAGAPAAGRPLPAPAIVGPGPAAAAAVASEPPSPASPSTAGPAGPARGAPGQPAPRTAKEQTQTGTGEEARAEQRDEDGQPAAGGAAKVPLALRGVVSPQLVTMLVIEGPVGPVPTENSGKADAGDPTHLGALRGSKDKAPAPTQAQLIDRIDRFLGAAVAAEGRPTEKLVLTTPSGQLVLWPLASPPPAVAALERDGTKPEGPVGGRAMGAGPSVIAEPQWLVEGGKADVDVLLARVGLFTQMTQRTRQLGEVELPAPAPERAPTGQAPTAAAPAAQAPAGPAPPPASSEQKRLVLRFRLLPR